jgi:hypothetical protein
VLTNKSGLNCLSQPRTRTQKGQANDKNQETQQMKTRKKRRGKSKNKYFQCNCGADVVQMWCKCGANVAQMELNLLP